MNPFLLFQNLTPKPPLMVGMIVGHTENDSIVELPQGGTIIAKGKGMAVGKTVYIRGGEVKTEAPLINTIEVTLTS